MKIDTTGMTTAELEKLGLSRTTIWRARRRGWAVIGYHNARAWQAPQPRPQPEPPKIKAAPSFVDRSAFDAREARVIAENAAKSAGFRGSEQYDDAVQEAWLKLWIMSPWKSRAYAFAAARNQARKFRRDICLKWDGKIGNPNNDELFCPGLDVEWCIDRLRDAVGEETFEKALRGQSAAVEAVKEAAWT